MPENFKNSPVIGGNGGIGSSSVVKLLDDGFNVVASYNNNKHRLEKIIQNPQEQERLKLINLDAASDEDMKSKINELIGLYGLRCSRSFYI